MGRAGWIVGVSGHMDLKLEVVIDPDLPTAPEGAVLFDADPSESGPLVYGSHSKSPLSTFYEDLVAGVPMPLTFAMRRVAGAYSVVAAALFLGRDLAVLPTTPSLVYSIDLSYR